MDLKKKVMPNALNGLDDKRLKYIERTKTRKQQREHKDAENRGKRRERAKSATPAKRQKLTKSNQFHNAEAKEIINVWPFVAVISDSIVYAILNNFINIVSFFFSPLLTERHWTATLRINLNVFFSLHLASGHIFINSDGNFHCVCLSTLFLSISLICFAFTRMFIFSSSYVVTLATLSVASNKQFFFHLKISISNGSHACVWVLGGFLMQVHIYHPF